MKITTIAIVVLILIVLFLYYRAISLNWKIGYYEYFLKKYKDRFEKEQWEFIEDVLNQNHFGKKYFHKKFPSI
ncbi:MAG: hypothetical protein LBN27_10740 [Prevotellaceae bacterium]|jgi:hypothetical protein|nr:hypothetical protein [Prevotellaceae bacterium]